MIEMSGKRRYSREFKSQAVEMIIHGGHPVKEVARELGVPLANLNRWRQQFLKAAEPKGASQGLSPASMEQELRKLRRELDEARMERDILKKAVRIFSQPRGDA